MRAATSIITSVALTLLAATAFGGPAAAETTTLRMTWYSDGNEGEVMADLLKRFHEQNKDIEIVLDQVPYKAVNETLPVQLASGQGPDMARIVDMGGLSRFALDMRPCSRTLRTGKPISAPSSNGCARPATQRQSQAS